MIKLFIDHNNMTATQKYHKRQEIGEMLMLANEAAAPLPEEAAALITRISSEMADIALQALDTHHILCGCEIELKTDVELAMDLCIKCAMEMKCKMCGKQFEDASELLFLSQDRVCMTCDANIVRGQLAR